MIYRTIRWSDFSICKNLFYTTFDMDEDKYFFKAWNNRHKEASYIVTIYSSIVGFVLVDREFCIQYLAVDSQFRGQNVGSELMKRVCNALSDAPSIWLKTASDPRLKFWYTKFGFEENHTYLDSNKEYIGTCMIRRQRGRFSRHNSIDSNTNSNTNSSDSSDSLDRPSKENIFST